MIKNCLGKKWTDAEKKKLSDAHKGQIPSNKDKPKTDFGEKFFEKFGLHYHDNVKLFVYHYNWYHQRRLWDVWANSCKLASRSPKKWLKSSNPQ